MLAITRRRNRPFLLLAAGALGVTAVVWFAMPHDREVKALWVLLVKLVPFVLATEAIALLDLDQRVRARLALVAVPASFLVFFLFFVPRIFFYSDQGDTLYYYVLTLTPYLIMALALAYRLGGGAAAAVRRLAYAMLLLMLSGLEDLAFLTINPLTDPRFAPMPEVWSWASHMTVFLGHPPTKYQAFAFIAIHVALAALVLFLPGRVIGTLWGRIARHRQGGAGGVVDAAP